MKYQNKISGFYVKTVYVSFRSKIIYNFLFTKLFPKLFLEKSKKNFATKAKTFVFML